MLATKKLIIEVIKFNIFFIDQTDFILFLIILALKC